jgi:hypothetical protein
MLAQRERPCGPCLIPREKEEDEEELEAHQWLALLGKLVGSHACLSTVP